jgi:hypothetical protein
MAQEHVQLSEVIDLRLARQRDLTDGQVACHRFTEALRLSGMSDGAFSNVLSKRLGWPVATDTVTAWRTSPPPSDALVAAERVAGVEHTPPAGIPVAGASGIRFVDHFDDLQAALCDVVDGANEVLAVTGSRSREPSYLAHMESVLVDRPGLVHYRVLYGPPRHGALKNHLLRLADLQRRPGTLWMGIVRDLMRDHERFICASENTAVVVQPSVHSLLNFDTAVIHDDPDRAALYVDHVRQAYLSADPLATRDDVAALEVQR